MFKDNIDKAENKNKIAIVVVGYNRIKSLTRLLNSLLDAEYPSTGVPLIISIDASGDEKLYKYIQEFKWPFGEKYVNIQKERLGLKNHIFQCGDLTKWFKAIVLLEDDLFVSPFFYDYVEKMVAKFGEEDGVAEISLYKNEYNGYACLPFTNIQDGSDVFLMQDVSTWGQCWTEQMWTKFVQWRDSHSEADIQSVDMPQRIKTWERAWSKYYNAYVVDTGRHVLYPNVSLTTNFSDAGEHGGAQNSVVQVNLLQGKKTYYLRPIEALTSYDIYDNNEALPQWLGLEPDDVCLDMYGIHDNQKSRYVLSTRVLPYMVVRRFALYMRPWELNIKYMIEGEGVYLYDTKETTNKRNQTSSVQIVVPYFLGEFNHTKLWSYMWRWIQTRVLRKLKNR